jgi:hypothetical protein|tara:strand:+ start:384 stop:488 length:105 start_codon:yes stop_codon:yes gene_type:complete
MFWPGITLIVLYMLGIAVIVAMEISFRIRFKGDE